MFVVVSRKGPNCKQIVTRRWTRANDLARRAHGQGWKVRVETFFTDVLVTNKEGEFIVVKRRVVYHVAESFQRSWAVMQRDSVCVLWPSEMPLPSSWTVIEDDDKPEGDLPTTRDTIGKRKKKQAA